MQDATKAREKSEEAGRKAAESVQRLEEELEVADARWKAAQGQLVDATRREKRYAPANKMCTFCVIAYFLRDSSTTQKTFWQKRDDHTFVESMYCTCMEVREGGDFLLLK